jgi:hypothetical protein
MTPAEIYKAVRDFLVIAAIAFVAWRIYTDGKNAVTAEQFTQFQKQIEQQSITAQQWHIEATNANTDFAASLARINAAPVLTHDWVQPQQSCPGLKVLPPTASAAGSGPSAGGGTQRIPGAPVGDSAMRDSAVADFKRQWEARLATWRAEHAQWPQP